MSEHNKNDHLLRIIAFEATRIRNGLAEADPVFYLPENLKGTKYDGKLNSWYAYAFTVVLVLIPLFFSFLFIKSFLGDTYGILTTLLGIIWMFGVLKLHNRIVLKMASIYRAKRNHELHYAKRRAEEALHAKLLDEGIDPKELGSWLSESISQWTKHRRMTDIAHMNMRVFTSAISY